MAKYLNLRFAYLFPILYIGRLNGAIIATIVIQGLLYRWTEHSILPISTGGGLFNPNATQTHSIFVKI